MEYVNLLGVVVALALIGAMWVDVKRALGEIRELIGPAYQSHLHYDPDATDAEEYCIWGYREGQWQLERECTAPGFEVSFPPGREGLYEGEVVKTRGVETHNRLAPTA